MTATALLLPINCPRGMYPQGIMDAIVRFSKNNFINATKGISTVSKLCVIIPPHVYIHLAVSYLHIGNHYQRSLGHSHTNTLRPCSCMSRVNCTQSPP